MFFNFIMAIKNQFKTFVFLALLTLLLMAIGSVWGTEGIIIGFAFALVMNVGSYWFSDKIVLKMYRAKEVSPSEDPKLHGIVEEIVRKAKMPKPKVCVIDSSTPNAFATGRNPKNSAVAVTSGIMDLLDDKELEGVIAHEISHIKNRDTLIQTVVATIAGAITYIAFMARWAAIFGRGNRDGSGLELLAMAIVAPIAATLIQLGISRSREYIADNSGANLIGEGEPLASALEKLEAGNKRRPMRSSRSSATSSLFIVNPFSARGVGKLFSTHPSTEERVKRLRKIK